MCILPIFKYLAYKINSKKGCWKIIIFGNKSLNEIQIKDIQNLIDDKREESTILEYKAIIDKNTKEIAKDISAMANSEGGIIIYGVTEEDNLPKKVNWIASSSKGAERLDQVVSSTITPICNIFIRTIKKPKSEKKEIYLVYVPRSEDLHMVLKDNDNRHYVRRNKSIQRMEGSEVKLRYKDIIEKEEKESEYITELDLRYEELSGFKLDEISHTSIFVIPNSLNEKISIDELGDFLQRPHQSAPGVSSPCYGGNFLLSKYREEHKARYDENVIVHKTGCVVLREKFTSFSNEDEPSILLYDILRGSMRLIKFSFDLFNKMQYFGGFKIKVELRNYKKMYYSPDFFGTAGSGTITALKISEEISLGPVLLLTDEIIKRQLKELSKKITGYAGLSIDNFKKLMADLERTGILEKV